jgi:hypothetical protein
MVLDRAPGLFPIIRMLELDALLQVVFHLRHRMHRKQSLLMR